MMDVIKLTDFNNICRLCLTKHDEQFVQLFSKQKVTKDLVEKDLLVAKVVESFCGIQVRDEAIECRGCGDCLFLLVD